MTSDWVSHYDMVMTNRLEEIFQVELDMIKKIRTALSIASEFDQQVVRVS